jgi:ABC-2 type transport system ATP-binding protein
MPRKFDRIPLRRHTEFVLVRPNRPALRVRDLRKAYRDVVAVDGVDIEVIEGECFGLLGPNGAGKTTTIEICEGLIEPDSGEVEVLGLHWKDDPQLLRDRLGVQLQETQLSERLTVRETLRLFRSFYSKGPSIGDLIARFKLDEKRNARVNELSGGQRQALTLACSLVGDPDLLFLDEPTTGLDPQARRHIWDVIEQLKLGGRTIVLTTHYMEEADRLCDHVAIMDRGKIIAVGTPQDLVASLGAGHIIEFSAEDLEAGLDVTALPQIDGIQDVRKEKGGVRVLVRELHQSIPALLCELARQGVRLTALRTHSASLEDVFVALTGRSLRNE